MIKEILPIFVSQVWEQKLTNRSGEISAVLLLLLLLLTTLSMVVDADENDWVLMSWICSKIKKRVVGICRWINENKIGVMAFVLVFAAILCNLVIKVKF
jgi:hypothetical protein